MKISDMINQLSNLLEKEGDIKVCIKIDGGYCDFWDYVYNEIEILSIDEHAQPDGPKSGNEERCLILS